jgi:cytochrome bd-type quinol oxidase subunit 2
MARLPAKLDFVAVLILLLAGVILGVAAPTSGVLVVTQLALLAAALLVALEVSGLHARRRRVIRSVTLLAVLGAVAGQVIGSDDVSDWSASVIGIVLAVVAPVLIFLGLRRTTDTITQQTVAGVLSIYLLIGLGFAAVFGVIDAATNGPIFTGVDAASTSDRLYFSFVTLATVGYGDLVPATRGMRAAAVGAAIIGQIYLVSIVAVVVGNIGRSRRSTDRDGDGEPPPTAPT